MESKTAAWVVESPPREPFSRSLAWLGAVVLAAGLAGAADAPKLKVLGGFPSEQGQWRFQITKMAGGDAAMTGHAMTVCMDAAKQMAEEARKSGGREGACTLKVFEDSATRAAFETTCDGKTSRSTLQREGPTAFLVSVATAGQDGIAMEGRYSYVGPC